MPSHFPVLNEIRWCLHCKYPTLSPSHVVYPSHQVTLIPGDGVGAEITDSVKEIFDYVNAPIEWEQYNVSGMSSADEDLFNQAMESLKRNRVGLKGKDIHYPTLASANNVD